MKHLSDDQKWELAAPMREKQKAEMERYFAMSPKERTKYLDERIDRSEKMRKEREQKAASGNGGGQPGAIGFGGGPGGNKVALRVVRRAEDRRSRLRKSTNGGSNYSNGRLPRSAPRWISSART